MTASDTHRAIAAVWRIESPRLIAGLARIARCRPCRGPCAGRAGGGARAVAGVRHPGQSRRLAHGHRQASRHRPLRRKSCLERKHEELGREVEVRQEMAETDFEAALDDEIGDDLLRLIFTACHPVLSTEARVALTLRLLGGLTTDEIARAFLVPEPTIAQRIVRAKRTLAEARVPFEVPRGAELAARLSSVLEVIYLIFNEGYSATAGDDWMRPALCEDALRLGRILAELAPREPEVHGLVALMEIQASRAQARDRSLGEPVLLLDQDRARWDQLLIRRGLAALARAEKLGGALGPTRCRPRSPPATRARARAGGDGLDAHRGALRCARPALALAGGGAEPRGGGRHGVRPGGGPRDSWMRSTRSPRSRAITCCRACAATCLSSSAASTRRARSSSARRHSPATPASANCCWSVPAPCGNGGTSPRA